MTKQIPDDLFEPENIVASAQAAQDVVVESFEGTMAFLDEQLG